MTEDRKTPLLTVITVVLNCERTLEQTIQSVLHQGYPNIEYIVIDGGSTDGTLDIIRRYSDRIAYWSSERDNGIYDAMNKGITAATGDLVGLLNSDDYYEQGALEQVAAVWRSLNAKDKAIIYGDYLILDEDSGVKTEFRSDLRFWRGMTICHQAMFVSRDIYRTAKYDTSLKYAADYAFFLDAIRSGVRFVPAGKFVVTFRNVGASYNKVWPSYRESLSVLGDRFGFFSRYYAMLLFSRVSKGVLAAAVKKLLKKIVNKDTMVSLKIVYNKISGRTFRKP